MLGVSAINFVKIHKLVFEISRIQNLNT